MKEQNCNFRYDIDLDDKFHVRNIFWTNAGSKAAYEAFENVGVNEMPFTTFVGVNHHNQSILLGYGLLLAEDTKSFVWLFESWVRCMSGNLPSGLLTDQCRAIQKAIEIVLPNIHHRWCLWHIMRKIPNKLKGYVVYKRIKCAMK